ncbi:CRISPR-associated endonuclease Cas1 [Anaerolineae bacterium]|nr:CRISPR-associated endonuclease Cas1 [Anaerolineae bacterium]
MSMLYLTEQNASVRLDDQTLLVNIPEDKQTGREAHRVRVPLGKVHQVVVYGNVTLTTPAIAALLEQKAEITYLTRFGKFVGRVSGDDHKHGQLRLIQRRAHDDPTLALHVATACVRSKLHNQRTLLLRSNRGQNDGHIGAAAEIIGQLMKRLDDLPSEAGPPPDPSRPQAETASGSLLGLEGSAAAAYFGVYGDLFINEWQGVFTGRHKRPPTDPINALLSYGYVILTNQAVAAAQIVGFDPYVGFLHSTQYGKPALALDVIEMFRVPIVDSVVLTLLNNRMLCPDDFEEGLGSWRLTDAGRKVFLQKYEERLNTEIIHPVFKTKVTYRRCLELQMRLLSRWLLGELKRFREFHTR